MPNEEKLSRREAARLAELEQVIERAEQDRDEALLEVHDQRLYREQYNTFEQYCQQRWNISGNWGKRLVNYARKRSDLPMGTVENERQARELEHLDPMQAAAVVKKVADSGEEVTAKKIRQARIEMLDVAPLKRYIATPEEKERRSVEALRLWDEGYHALDICAELGISKSTLYADLAFHGKRTDLQRPVAGRKPKGHPMEVREWRNQPEEQQADADVIRLRLVPGKAACDLDRESADRFINNADAGSEALGQYVKNGYELTESQVERLVMIRDRIDRLIREAAEQKGVG